MGTIAEHPPKQFIIRPEGNAAETMRGLSPGAYASLDAALAEIETHTPNWLTAANGYTITVGEISTGAKTVGVSIPHSPRPSYNFNIFFAGRNGFWTQELRMKFVDDG